VACLREDFVVAASDLINLSGLIDNVKCFALLRQHRWPQGARCPVCDSGAAIQDGRDDAQPCRQRYRCKACTGRFDLSNRQIAGELGLALSDVQAMREQLRHGMAAKNPTGDRRRELLCADEGRRACWVRPSHDGAGRRRPKGSLMRPEVVERRLNSIPELSCRGKPINGLFRLLVGSDLIWERAYADVASNKGALTAGVEPANTLDGFSLERIARIRAKLPGGAYRFRPVRR